MENGQNTKTNPWIVETLDVYLHYCCPECDHKTKTKTLFVKHVFSTHPDAKGNFLRSIDSRVSVQGVKSLGGHFACLCRGLNFIK